MKPYACKVKTNFYGNKMPKKGGEFICQSVAIIDFIYKYAGSKQNTER